MVPAVTVKKLLKNPSIYSLVPNEDDLQTAWYPSAFRHGQDILKTSVYNSHYSLCIWGVSFDTLIQREWLCVEL